MTAMLSSTAGVTVNTVDPVAPANAALIVVGPTATALANPFVPWASEIVAMPVSDEPHVTSVVRSCVELSENVPVAVNCWVRPSGTDGFAGVTAIDCRAAEVTVRSAWPDAPVAGSVARMNARPGPVAVARPTVGAALETVATTVASELQVTESVTFAVVPSENVPVAVNWTVVRFAILGAAGETAMHSTIGAVTEMPAVPDVPSTVATIVVAPTPSALARPCVPAVLEIAATEPFVALHIADAVRFLVEPSEKVPVAVS